MKSPRHALKSNEVDEDVTHDEKLINDLFKYNNMHREAEKLKLNEETDPLINYYVQADKFHMYPRGMGLIARNSDKFTIDLHN
jgi:hypothetical protein